MYIIGMGKKKGERRCFKVLEFDSSERLFVTSVPLCVGTFVLCEIETGKDEERQKLLGGGDGEGLEIDPRKMADKGREKKDGTPD